MIRAPKVRLIDEKGKQVGILSASEALRMAEDAGLDLVEVSPTAEPPVCKLMDYGKYKYMMRKKAHEAKKKQSIIHVKEVKLSPKTEEHDLQFKLRNIKRFLEHGNKVKVAIFFRGREITHPELGVEMLKRVTEEIKAYGVVEQEPKLEGRNMSMLIAPHPAKG